jgi:hypothetical protein
VRMRSRAVRRLVVWTVVLGWALPSGAEAQSNAIEPIPDAASAASASPTEVDPASTAGVTRAGPSEARAKPPSEMPEPEPEEDDLTETARYELSFALGPALTFGGGGLGGLAGLGGVAGLNPGSFSIGVPVALDLGIPLGSRALLVIGGSALFTNAGGADSVSATLPIGVLVYLDRPRAGAFIPTLRVTAIGGLISGPGFEWASLGVAARGGLTWLPIEQLGIRAELGAHLTSAFMDAVWVNLGIEGALSLVIRA